MRSLVSVIVPIYNKAPYLNACLQAISTQTHTDFEAILIDDCSTDESCEICEAFAQRDPRFKLYRHTFNQGAAAARRTGISLAKGTWISFIDADDIPSPHLIETLLFAAIKEEADIAVCGFCYITKEGQEYGRFSTPKEYRCYSEKDCLPPLVQLYPIDTRFDVSLWNKIYRRSIIQSDWMVDCCSEDYLFNVQVFLNAKRVVHLPEVLYRVAMVDNSFSRSPLNEIKITALDANLVACDIIEKSRPDCYPKAIERLISQCAEFSLLQVRQCTMHPGTARRKILHCAFKAYRLALHYPYTEASRGARCHFINIFFPRLHNTVDAIYRRIKGI